MCCTFFALRGIADIAAAGFGGAVSYNYAIGVLMLIPVALYFAKPDIFPLVGGVIALIRGLVNTAILISFGPEVWQMMLAHLRSGHVVSLIITFLPLVVAVYCLVVAISRKSSPASRLLSVDNGDDA